MDFARFIRTLGYLVWVTLWSPVILLTLVIAPIWLVLTSIVNKYWSIGEAANIFKNGLMIGISRDAHFIKTGEFFV